jgi:hypothetical protein
MNPLAINMIRTYVPVGVGAVVSWLAARGIHVQPDQAAWAVASMTAVFSAAYYTIVRVLEERWPVIGNVLLLSKPAATLQVVGAAPAEPEDYGEGWPPRMDDASASVPPMASLPPTAADTQTLGGAGYLGPAHPAYQPPPPGPLRVRKAETGAIPVYRRPPGR